MGKWFIALVKKRKKSLSFNNITKKYIWVWQNPYLRHMSAVTFLGANLILTFMKIDGAHDC
jgi:hypothetical protein